MGRQGQIAHLNVRAGNAGQLISQPAPELFPVLFKGCPSGQLEQKYSEPFPGVLMQLGLGVSGKVPEQGEFHLPGPFEVERYQFIQVVIRQKAGIIRQVLEGHRIE
jgi:hypothetical protein